MKKIAYIFWLFLFTISFWVNAEYKVYTDLADFEKDKWAICEQATDWCNSYIVEDGKVTAWTLMYCMDHTPEWTCTKFKEDTITTLSLDTKEEPKMCTKEYMPVCAKVQVQCIKAPCNPILQTYSNSCMAWENEIVYQWACNTKLSENDLNFYNSIKTDKLEDKYQEKVNIVLEKYKNLLSKYSSDRQEYLNTVMLKLIDNHINSILNSNPQDIALPEKENIKYLLLKLLKFEIEILN
jgi:hypothetical protein